MVENYYHVYKFLLEFCFDLKKKYMSADIKIDVWSATVSIRGRPNLSENLIRRVKFIALLSTFSQYLVLLF